MKPSATAQAMLRRMQEAAQAEVDRHLAAGRAVHGRDKDGKPIVIYVSQLELANQTMDWEGPARP